MSRRRWKRSLLRLLFWLAVIALVWLLVDWLIARW